MKAAILRGGAAAVCLAAAVVLVLLAIDAHAWSSRFAADDLRYRRDATAHGLWRPRELSPAGIDRAALGIQDDVSYRRALQQFRLGRATEQLFTPSSAAHRVKAEIALTAVADSAGDPKRRSQADNLLGIVGFGLSTEDQSLRSTFINNAIDSFRRAIVLDPSDNDAFFNLEYALDQVKGNSEQQASGSQRLGQHGSAGLKPPGHGY